ncbi:MAG: DNA polymerase subunit beta [Calditrichaeota bacterium]|nr:DNA polymerase subunit beta [Calditrichota bacterium]
MSPADRETVRIVAECYGAKNIRLFGSTARGEDRPDSDIDILIDIEKERTLLDFIAIQQNLENLLDRKVDVLTERSISKYFREEVLAEAKPL